MAKPQSSSLATTHHPLQCQKVLDLIADLHVTSSFRFVFALGDCVAPPTYARPSIQRKVETFYTRMNQTFFCSRLVSLLPPTNPESFTEIAPVIWESIAAKVQETHQSMYLAPGSRNVLTFLRIRHVNYQGNQIHGSNLWTLGIPKIYMGPLGYNIQILH